MFKKKLQKLKEYLSKNLDKGFIVLSKAPFASLILFVIKLNNSLHFCVDYWCLNALTHWDQYSLPLIDETLTQITDCKFIIKFDIITAFNKLWIYSDSEKLMTFCTLMRVYKYDVLPFDLINESAFFQHYINNTLFKCLNDYVQAYLNNILIYSKTQQEHVKHVQNVLEKLQATGLQIDIKKSEFFIIKITFLDLLIFIDELRMNPQKIEVIMNWNAPQCLKEMQFFIDFCNFFQRFIKNFSKITHSLTQLSDKNKRFDWMNACQKVFELLKKTVTESLMLTHFD